MSYCARFVRVENYHLSEERDGGLELELNSDDQEELEAGMARIGLAGKKVISSRDYTRILIARWAAGEQLQQPDEQFEYVYELRASGSPLKGSAMPSRGVTQPSSLNGRVVLGRIAIVRKRV